MVLPSESEILDRVKTDWSKPLVTFLCMTYNQESYIEQAIKGFLIQKTSFPYEILIHDDCSTDKTKKIIESYIVKYPNIIRCIFQSQNQYSQGKSPALLAAYEAKSDYIALCEGDDYWIDENKIEKQFNLILNDNSISMVLSPGKLEVNGKLVSKLHCYYGSEIKFFTAQDVLNVPGQFAPTASYILKKECLIKAKENFISAPIGDLFYELYCAVNGKLVYYPEVGSVYRVMAKGSWSSKMKSKTAENMAKYVHLMESIINKSKKIDGFKDLNWSIKRATLYLGLALAHLNDNNFKSFSNAIEKSYSISVTTKAQKILYLFRDKIFFIRFIIKPLIKIKETINFYF